MRSCPSDGQAASRGSGIEKPFPHHWTLAASVSRHTGMSKLQPWPLGIFIQLFIAYKA